MLRLKPILYFSFNLFISLLAAYFLVVYYEAKSVATLFSSYYFYALGYFAISFLLVEFIHFITKRLSERDHNSKLTSTRIMQQFVIGFLVTSLFAFLFTALFYWINRNDILAADDFFGFYGMILLFIFIVNLIYLFVSYNNITKTNNFNVNLDILTDEGSKQPAIIFHEDKSCFAIDFRGVKTVWPITIEKTQRNLDDKIYFQINRQCIIHRAAIRSIRPFNVKHVKIEPILSCQIELITSRRITSLFKVWVSKK